MEFAARVVHVERRAAGASIGYGRACKLEKDAVVAVVSAGYADGYDRRLSGKGVVTIRGAHAPVLGRVSMDMISVDATGVPDVATGDKAILFSNDPAAPNSVEAIAKAIDTIPYCLVCGVSKRVARVYKR
jgi:alanine racemase